MLFEKTKILIVEDHPHYLNGIANYIKSNLKLNEIVIDPAPNGSSAIQLLSTKNYDIAIIDVSLPDISGIEVIQYIRKKQLKTKTIVNSYDYNTIQLQDLRKCNVDCIMTKGDDEEMILEMIEKVLNNEKHFSYRVKKQIETLDETFNITTTEKEILELLCKGLKTEQIALERNISLNTVNTHKKHIFNKFNVHNAAELATLATKLGLV